MKTNMDINKVITLADNMATKIEEWHKSLDVTENPPERISDEYENKTTSPQKI